MPIRYTVGGYWDVRAEPAEGCAGRLGRLLSDLASECDELFGSWYEPAGSRAAALKQEVDWSQPDVLRELVQQGRRSTSLDKNVIPELGFGVGLWNGRAESTSVTLHVTCGLHATVSGLCNSVKFDLPYDLGRFVRSSNTRNALLAIVRAWEPTWAGVFSVDVMLSRGLTVHEPFADWMLYLRDSPRKIGTLPDTVIAEQTDDGGLLVFFCDEAPQLGDATHQRKVRQVEQALGISV